MMNAWEEGFPTTHGFPTTRLANGCVFLLRTQDTTAHCGVCFPTTGGGDGEIAIWWSFPTTGRWGEGCFPTTHVDARNPLCAH